MKMGSSFKVKLKKEGSLGPISTILNRKLRTM